MRPRNARRVEILLAIRRREEQQARLAFQAALGQAEAAARRLVELDLQLAAGSRAARQALLARRAGGAGEAYRAGAADLRGQIGRYQSELRRLDGSLEQHRRQLAEATRERKAVERLRERVVAAGEAARGHFAAAEQDDRHAARVTAGEKAGA